MVRIMASREHRGKLIRDARQARQSLFRWRLALFAVIIYNIVGVLDIVSTIIAIETGAGYEANPLIRTAMEEWGAGWIAAKLSLQGVVTAMVLYFPHLIVLGFFITATSWNGWIVYNNFAIAGVF